jgi:uncharacterized repeat protein (TIGR01451 family)
VVITEITVSPNQGATLQSVDDKIQVVFPPGAFESETRVKLVKRALPLHPVGPLEFQGTAFGLSAYGPNGVPVTELGEPVTLTVDYYGGYGAQSAAAVGDALNVYWWDGNAWQGLLPCEGCSHTVEPARFVVLLDHLTEFAVLAGEAPALTIGKEVSTSGVAGTMATYILVVENVGNDPATGVSFADTLPAGMTYEDSDGIWDGTEVTWTVGDLAPGATASGRVSARLTCEAGVRVANDTYSVGSDQGATVAGATVAFTTLAPTIELTLVSFPDPGILNEAVTLTATASTNGTPLSYEWNFGDGPVSGGLVETHVWDAGGSHTVTFTATDECDHSETVSKTVTVETDTFYIYLPMVLRHY